MARRDEKNEDSRFARIVPPHIFAFSLRSVLYLLAFIWIFCFTVAELGLVSNQLHKYGDDYTNYGTKAYKHALGLLLFSTIASLLVLLAHPFVSVGMISFWSFVMAVFFGTSAGIIERVAPFTGHGCTHQKVEAYPENWRPWVGECNHIVSIQGIAWALWALYIFLWVGTLMQKLRISVRATPEGFYAAKVVSKGASKV